MNEVYNITKLLLVPSTVEEAFARVVVEANMHSIPVIARNIGGISEALNNSGILIDDNNVENWGDKINFLLNNEVEYNKYSLKSFLSSLKFKRNFVSEFLNIIEEYKID